MVAKDVFRGLDSDDQSTSMPTIHGLNIQRSQRCNPADAISEVAAQAGIHIDPAALVKHYAQRLLDAPDATAVHNFDLCSWDAGELLWAMNNWSVQD